MPLYLKNNYIKTSLFLAISVILYLTSKFFNIAPNIIPLSIPIFIPLLNNVYYSIIFIVGFLFINSFLGLFIQVIPLIILFFFPVIVFTYSKKYRYFFTSMMAIISIFLFIHFFNFLVPELLKKNFFFYTITIIGYVVGINLYNIIILELSNKIKNYILNKMGKGYEKNFVILLFFIISICILADNDPFKMPDIDVNMDTNFNMNIENNLFSDEFNKYLEEMNQEWNEHLNYMNEQWGKLYEESQKDWDKYYEEYLKQEKSFMKHFEEIWENHLNILQINGMIFLMI
ncbi:hypothetical protein [Marinitoga lauensis]|uniref:hypothetical protein n=1 Tax=Marinitoga lauensis TaxID=2201189 RepID=UPI0010119093|nr:hypothetical protein [Marinitoga lauensis]